MDKSMKIEIQTVVNRRVSGGFRRETQRRSSSAVSAQTSANSAVNLVLAIALMCAIGAHARAQEPTAAPSPPPVLDQTLRVPSIAIDYRANANQPLPELNRFGVDTNE